MLLRQEKQKCTYWPTHNHTGYTLGNGVYSRYSALQMLRPLGFLQIWGGGGVNKMGLTLISFKFLLNLLCNVKVEDKKINI